MNKQEALTKIDELNSTIKELKQYVKYLNKPKLLSKDELIELLQKGKVGEFNTYRENSPDKWIDLSNTNLENVNLGGDNLEYANLSNANLKGSDLRVVDFVSVNFSGVLFDNTTITIGGVNRHISGGPNGLL